MASTTSGFWHHYNFLPVRCRKSVSSRFRSGEDRNHNRCLRLRFNLIIRPIHCRHWIALWSGHHYCSTNLVQSTNDDDDHSLFVWSNSRSRVFCVFGFWRTCCTICVWGFGFRHLCCNFNVCFRCGADDVHGVFRGRTVGSRRSTFAGEFHDQAKNVEKSYF
jgi:hypothetical protein